MYNSSFHSRIKMIEDKMGGQNFFERMDDIFLIESFEKLTSKDVANLKKFMPEIYKVTSANV